MSRGQRRISVDDFPQSSSRNTAPARFDDKSFSKFQLDKVISKDKYAHTCLAWLSDGSSLVAGASDGTIQAFAADKLAAVWSLDTSGASGVTHIAPNPQRPSYIAAAFRDLEKSENSTLRHYDIRIKPGKDASKVITRTETDLLALAFHPGGTRLLIARRNGKLTLYDTRKVTRKDSDRASPAIIKERQLHWDLNDAQFSPDGQVIIAAYGLGNRGGLRILDAADLSDVAEHCAHALPAVSITQAAAPGRPHLIALGSNDFSVSVWDVQSMAVARMLTMPDDAVHSVSFSGDGSMLAYSGTRDARSDKHLHQDTVEIASINHSDLYAPCKVHRMDMNNVRVTDLSWSPTQPMLALCGDVGQSRKEYHSNVWVYCPRAN